MKCRDCEFFYAAPRPRLENMGVCRVLRKKAPFGLTGVHDTVWSDDDCCLPDGLTRDLDHDLYDQVGEQAGGASCEH